MNINVLFNVPHEFALSPIISTYFFLLGMGGGCSMLSIWATLTGKKDYKPIAKIGAVFVIILFCCAPLLLIIDLGQPLRFWYFVTLFNFSSPLTWGSIFLCLYPIFASAYITFMFMGWTRTYKALAWCLLPVAIGYITYIGFVVSMGVATPAWNTPIMPAYFVTAAMSTAIAWMTMVAIVRYWLLSWKWSDEQRGLDFAIIIKLTRFLSLFLVINLFFVFTQQVHMRFGSDWAATAAQFLLEGKMGMSFGIITLLFGTFLPLLVIALPKINKQLPILFVCMFFVVIGIYVMRFSITTGSQFLPIM
ncbi:MAG TPA: NrfD/PsrC family molybdoenzyme membrane anchor subunit [Nitrospirota bacterium]|jgi:molybdopterin-containing oxidoreductase family membrane subunit